MSLQEERGSVGLLAVMAGLAFAGIAVVVLLAVVDAATAMGRARTAADAAALAAMHASPLAGGDGDAQQAAEPVAAANRARLVSLDARVAPTGAYGWPLAVGVRVSAAPATQLVRALMPDITVDAAAALAPPAPAAAAPPAAPTASPQVPATAPPPVPYENGRLPSSALAPIGVGGHRLWPPAAAAFRRLANAASVAGVRVAVTDAYRPYDAQVDVARRKGLYAQGGAAAAPGTSDHGWGRAVDLDLDQAAQAWLRANAGRFGFVEDVPGEPWHWTYRGVG